MKADIFHIKDMTQAYSKRGISVRTQDYVYVYTFEDIDMETFTPEEIYRLLNLDHPEDYMFRSLSVGDIVNYECTTTTSAAFRCEIMGFSPVALPYGFSERLKGRSHGIV